MLSLLNALEQKVLDTLPGIETENDLIDYKNTILGKNGELTVILK